MSSIFLFTQGYNDSWRFLEKCFSKGFHQISVWNLTRICLLQPFAQHSGSRRQRVWTEAFACLHGVERMDECCSRLAPILFFRSETDIQNRNKPVTTIKREQTHQYALSRAMLWKSCQSCRHQSEDMKERAYVLPLQHNLFLRRVAGAMCYPCLHITRRK